VQCSGILILPVALGGLELLVVTIITKYSRVQYSILVFLAWVCPTELHYEYSLY